MVINSVSFDMVFGSDSPRVMWDWSERWADHHRSSTHPLYVILIFPIIKILSLIGFNNYLTIILFLSILSTANVYLTYLIINRFLKKKSLVATILFVIIYSFSFCQLENALVIESFVVSAFTLLLFWNWFVYKKDKALKVIDYIVLIVLGMLCFSILSTNYLHFLLGISFLFIFKKQGIKDFFSNLLIALLVVFGSHFYSLIF